MEIFEIIKKLSSKKEIDDFVKLRLNMINNSEIKEIGIETDTNCYKKLLNEKIKVNTTCNIYTEDNVITDCIIGSVVFDDNNIYKYLIKAIKKSDNVYEAVYKATKKYVSNSFIPNSIIEKTRNDFYARFSGCNNKPLSIKLLRNVKLSMCTEMAGIAHNMFRFLGIESDMITPGICIPNIHSYNIIYPEGRDKYAILCDIQSSGGSLPKMIYLDDNKRNDLFLNKLIIVGTEDIIKAYKVLINANIKSYGSDSKYVIPKDAYIKTLMEYKYPEKAKELVYRTK